MLKKTHLPCCAICFLSGTNNDTSIQELEALVRNQRREAFSKDWKHTGPEEGQRAILTVTAPNEAILGEKLKVVGFRRLSNRFNRRNGYPRGKLTLWAYQF